MFSRTLVFRQILSGLKRFPVDELSQQLVRKIYPFYGQTRHMGLPAQPISFRSRVSVNGYSP